MVNWKLFVWLNIIVFFVSVWFIFILLLWVVVFMVSKYNWDLKFSGGMYLLSSFMSVVIWCFILKELIQMVRGFLGSLTYFTQFLHVAEISWTIYDYVSPLSAKNKKLANPPSTSCQKKSENRWGQLRAVMLVKKCIISSYLKKKNILVFCNNFVFGGIHTFPGKNFGWEKIYLCKWMDIFYVCMTPSWHI